MSTDEQLRKYRDVTAPLRIVEADDRREFGGFMFGVGMLFSMFALWATERSAAVVIGSLAVAGVFLLKGVRKKLRKDRA